MKRREFLVTSAAAAAALSLPKVAQSAPAEQATGAFRYEPLLTYELMKAVGCGMKLIVMGQVDPASDPSSLVRTKVAWTFEGKETDYPVGRNHIVDLLKHEYQRFRDKEAAEIREAAAASYREAAEVAESLSLYHDAFVVDEAIQWHVAANLKEPAEFGGVVTSLVVDAMNPNHSRRIAYFRFW